MAQLEHLNFENSYVTLPEVFFHRVKPTPFSAAQTISVNSDAAALLDLNLDQLTRAEFPEV